MSPAIQLLNLIAGKWVTQALRVAARLGIADLLKDGPKPCDELARANQVEEQALYRVLRALASLGVFQEVGPREFALTPMAEFLRSDLPGSLRAMATFCGDPWSWRPWEDTMRCVKTGEPAFERMHGQTLFDYFREHPADGAVFDEAMTGLSQQTAAAVVTGYDFGWARLVVDVGGGQGALLCAILRAHPATRGIVFDLDTVMPAAQQKLAAEGLGERCQFAAGSFFDSVPANADAYVLRHILHDWDEPRAATILANIRRACTPQSRLLIVETVIPPGNDPFFGKLLDMEMLVMAGGRERTEAEYRDLLANAGFRLTRVVPTASMVSVVESVPV